MENTESQQSRSASTQIKRLGDDVKACLEGWYEDLGKPPVLSLAEKTSIMHHIQSEIEPVGITLGQLNRWLTHRRRAERNSGKSFVIPRHKRFSMSILFPTLTGTELDHLKILVEENPKPSPDLLMVWVDSPLLPNVTLDDAHRFVKYTQAQMQSNNNAEILSSGPKSGSHQDDSVGDADESDEEDMLDDQSYLMVPETIPQELRITKPDPSLSPTLHHPLPMSSLPTTQLPRDPHALLELLRSHLSTDEFKQLLQEGSSDVTSISRTSIPSVEPIVYNHLPSPESQPHSPTPLSHKPSPSPTHRRLFSPGEVIEPSISIHNPGRTASANSSFPTQIPYSSKSTTVIPSPGFVSRKTFMDLSKLSFTATGEHISPVQFLKQFELCQKKSQELTTALERGHLRDFGMLPSKELRGLKLPGLPELPSHTATS